MNRRQLLHAAAIAVLAPSSGFANTPNLSSIAGSRALFRGRDGFITVGPFPEFGPGDFLFDYPRNRAGRLEITELGASLTSSFIPGGEVVATLRTRDDGRLSYLGQTYRQVAIERSAFSVSSDGAVLACEVSRAAHRRQRGVIVLLHGSGPTPKEGFDLWASHFIASGWAVVSYDKRGVGGSTGDWLAVGLETLADDAAAVIGHMRAAPDFRRLPLGVWGISQAGWIAPQLGARALVDFIVIHAGAAVTPGQQIVDMFAALMATDGASAEDIARARAYYTLNTDVSRGRAEWSAINAEFQRLTAQGAPWLDGPPAAIDAPERRLIGLLADFDPAPYWAQVRVPVLAIFGGRDLIVPSNINRPLLERMQPARADFTAITLSEANHIGFIAATGARREYPSATQLDPTYFPVLDRWLRTHDL